MTFTIRVMPSAAKPARKPAPRTVQLRRWTFPGTNPNSSGKRLTMVFTDPVRPRRSRNNLLLNTPSPRQASKPVGAREDSESDPSLAMSSGSVLARRSFMCHHCKKKISGVRDLRKQFSARERAMGNEERVMAVRGLGGTRGGGNWSAGW
jgi:hypothetical protein